MQLTAEAKGAAEEGESKELVVTLNIPPPGIGMLPPKPEYSDTDKDWALNRELA